ncbi:MAG: ABC transporter permease [Alphaproteobacteria bacterium]|jgi:ABC-2 type transport system permease protein|nr:ABC transporter permease [Alphaproteobacteria bacterium]
MWGRIKALVIKELLTVWRDKKSRMTLIVPPLMQLFLLAQAATLEVRNIEIAYYNQDSGWYSHELVQRIKGSRYFKDVHELKNLKEFENAIDEQRAIIGIHIQPDFSRNAAAGRVATVQLILDGRKANASQIVQGYVRRIIGDFNADILKIKSMSSEGSITSVFRSWFNPNLDYLIYNVPCMVGILSMVLGLMVTALSVAREREMGTFDQLLVSPLQPWQILIGKMLPAMIIAVGESTLIMGLAIVVYRIPFQGSLILFYLCMVLFITSIIGVGLFISSLSKTQQQANLGTFVFMVPTMLLSGFGTPIENMPDWLQPLTWFIPISHFFIIIKGIFLKNMLALEVLTHVWPIAFIAIFTLSIAAWMFKQRLE